MFNPDSLRLPFFDEGHHALHDAAHAWSAEHLTNRVHHGSVDARCQELTRLLGDAGWLRYCVPAAYGGMFEELDSRSLCLMRQTLGYYDGLADFAFVMQGLGSGPISLFGSEALKQKYLPKVARGDMLAAFALSEPDAGSDVAAMTTRATRTASGYRINGVKTWISNADIADFYTVFARVENDEAEGVTAFVVDANTPGLAVTERFDVCAPHPIGTLTFTDCDISVEQRIGMPGQGFKVALQNLDVFRASVGAAALGFAEAALDMGIARATSRPMFGATLADLQITQAAIGDMSTEIDAATLLVYRAAWERDILKQRTTRSAAMAKLFATESAQRIIDRCVQLHGGLGVKVGHPMEMLYREIRALRIYEGATEVQQVVIARETMKNKTGGVQK
ncbi:acyl-CoA dehydrogenase family protein [Alcaligenaceae bacterium LF4-65]|jgi:acyl-CoA dehydrogenase|uniref:Acyl-CoA dehydrogenase family protein n=1 Tax=Zwartia hollandica TaxID=324606 RepID=A0A953NDV3_9BURK|nr:acyl-CoA dehydrogenase family protein [Zwartia hollandica]MBZ1351406.1 acyl-CoA dehydrogenase family protein [Zwartia hollandica]